jgi:hypothetical protein
MKQALLRTTLGVIIVVGACLPTQGQKQYNNSITDSHQQIPKSNSYLIPPPGSEQTSSGFKNGDATIVVFDLNGYAKLDYATILANFTKDMDRSVWSGENVRINGEEGSFYTSKDGKCALIFGNADFAIQVVGFYKQDDPQMKKAVIESMLSIVYVDKSSARKDMQETMKWIHSKIKPQENRIIRFYGDQMSYNMACQYSEDNSSTSLMVGSRSCANRDANGDCPNMNETYVGGVFMSVHRDGTTAHRWSNVEKITKDGKDGIKITEVKDDKVTYSILFLDWNVEPNLYDRMFRALTDLSKASIPKEKY